METLISENPIHHLVSPFSSSTILFHLPRISRRNRSSLRFFPGKWHCSPKNVRFSCFAASSAPNPLTYGGWDDLRIVGDSDRSGESDQFRNFLIAIGIDDRKYVIMFLIGVVCALAISRIRVSSIVVFPASVIVFALGFSFGFVRGGSINRVSGNQSRRRSKADNFRVCDEKLWSLVEFFNGFDEKVSNLKNCMGRAVECREITVGDLDSYVKVMESIKLSAMSARKIVEGSIDDMELLGKGVESNDVLVENQKPSRRRKEVERNEFDFFRVFRGLFGENSLDLSIDKMKDVVRQELMETSVNGNKGNVVAPWVKDSVLNLVNDSKRNANRGFPQDTSNKHAMDQGDMEKFGDGAARTKIIPESEKMDSAEVNETAKRPLGNEKYSYQNNRLQFMNSQRISTNTNHDNEMKTRAYHDSLLDSMDFSVSLKHTVTEASFRQEQMLKNSNGAYMADHRKEENKQDNYRISFREENARPEDDHHLADLHSEYENEIGSSSSSRISDDVIFDRYLTEANGHLKHARECLKIGGDEGHAEVLLYKSSNLLSKAIAMKPMSLLAVGQLGNTYLLHGELKLKISRELRTQLSRSDPSFVKKRVNVLKGLDDQVSSKDKIASVLVNVCEECEGLLVEAGRRYRMALSIDGNDVRALYNWGLALSFRAQLIADIGPEAAVDADKVFLAAIDKFDAMMSRGNTHAPEDPKVSL
ncbi:uncharacterized protein LOC131144231 isoform X2 [Malania oleifera]|uniref:uncharacterized protein LOC131144231 isoform X2 n=1 Tax=Malania oleifera TaxID=397392 RepID=UPI0025AEBEBD|nr:uncharacterized protein LOC131144231 isoform X2 [Malania oleifera]